MEAEAALELLVAEDIVEAEANIIPDEKVRICEHHPSGKRHCELSFDSEREGRQLPPECRANPRLGLEHDARE